MIDTEVLEESVERELKFLKKNGFWVPCESAAEFVKDPRGMKSKTIKYLRDHNYGIAGMTVYKRLLDLAEELHAHFIEEKYIKT